MGHFRSFPALSVCLSLPPSPLHTHIRTHSQPCPGVTRHIPVTSRFLYGQPSGPWEHDALGFGSKSILEHNHPMPLLSPHPSSTPGQHSWKAPRWLPLGEIFPWGFCGCICPTHSLQRLHLGPRKRGVALVHQGYSSSRLHGRGFVRHEIQRAPFPLPVCLPGLLLDAQRSSGLQYLVFTSSTQSHPISRGPGYRRAQP